MRHRITITRVLAALGLVTAAVLSSGLAPAHGQGIEHAPPAFACAGEVVWSQTFTDSDANGYAEAPVRLLFGSTFLTGVSVPAGSYTIAALAWDGYDGRVLTPHQPNEQYALQFLDAGGAVIAQSGFTEDGIDTGLPDDFWEGSIGSVTLPDGAADVRIVHSVGQLPGAAGPNSVFPVGFCLTTVEDPSPTPTATPCPDGSQPGTDPDNPCPEPTPTPTSPPGETPTPTPTTPGPTPTNPPGGTPTPTSPPGTPQPSVTPTPGGGLPNTGSESGLLARWGLGILSVGLLLAGAGYQLANRPAAAQDS
jgi:hypothetical protein